MDIYQYTIANSKVIGRGIGIHSGVEVSVRFMPAPVDTGIVFVRNDLSDDAHIPAVHSNISATSYCTQLTYNGCSIATVEHIISAVVGCGIDNIYIYVDGPEIPIMDGSADEFIFALQIAKRQRQDCKRRYIKINGEIRVDDKHGWASLTEDSAASYSFVMDYSSVDGFAHPKTKEFTFNGAQYKHEIARARTFGFSSDIAKMQDNGLIKGASLDNAILLDGNKVVNASGLRFKDELVAHKILDAIGDMHLLGHRFIGKYTGFCSGHRINSLLCAKVAAKTDTWEYITLDD